MCLRKARSVLRPTPALGAFAAFDDAVERVSHADAGGNGGEDSREETGAIDDIESSLAGLPEPYRRVLGVSIAAGSVFLLVRTLASGLGQILRTR